ncbi:MAG: hypothetical protein QOE82_1270 [Thermoanaerobaculia bacterium]|nr:hypothetical protein [Thermoanaerobaculia bacterium]
MAGRAVDPPFSRQLVEEIIAGGESQSVEFTAHVPPDAMVSQVLTGFANSEGGFLFVGLNDHGTPAGLSADEIQRAHERMKQVVHSLFEGVRSEVGTMLLREGSVVYAFVAPAPDHIKPIATSRGKVYVRRGTATVAISPGEDLPRARTAAELRVFVAMSFREEEEPGLVDYWQAMKRAARAVSERIDLRRIDLKEGDYEISQKIMTEIDEADIVIADFTLSSRNVYFELGYARGKSKRLIQTARKGTDLEFDVRNWKTLFYRNGTELEEKLRSALDAAITDHTA